MKKAIIGLVVVVILGIIAVAGFKIYDNYQEKYRESEVVMPLDQYYQVPSGEAMVLFDETVYEKNLIFENNTLYMDLDTIKDHYGLKLFWDEGEQKLYYTTPSKAYVFTPGSSDYLVNRAVETSVSPYCLVKAGMPYVSLGFLGEYSNMTYRFYENPARVLFTWAVDSYVCADVKEKTSIRVSQDIKADLLTTLEPGARVRFIDGGGIQENGFVKVMSEDGVRGYILAERLGETYFVDPQFNAFTAEKSEPLLNSERVYLGWHLLYSRNEVDSLKNLLADNEDLTVVSPTWYFLNDIDGHFVSYDSNDYVSYAHSQGLQVWAVLKNDTIDGKFSCTDDSFKVLSSYESRNRLIDNVIGAVKACGADGINVDFEMLSVATGVYFIQFLKELSLECRKEGIILSVDNYVPENYNAYYDLASQADFVDYIVIMGYDEHYAGSDEAGSVASLSWFTRAADNTLAKCPANQIIMGVPFYTRLWKEVKDGTEIKLYVESTPNLREASQKVEKLGVEKQWKEEEGQYYIEYKTEEATYKMWIEDNESLQKKAYAIRERNLGGIAAWKLGDEASDTWECLWEALDGKLPEASEDQDTEGTGTPEASED